MMTGLLAAQGFRCSEKRVGESLKHQHPRMRQVGAERHLNPLPYRADYFGQKIHIDQNEKMVMFGVTYICGIDGYSGKVVGHIFIPRKNNILIYEKFYRYDVLY